MSTVPPTLDELASTLVRARSALGITQNELHKRTGISREAIKGYESGRNKPGARELKLLCEALHVSPNMLLFGTESPFESNGELYDLMYSSGQLDMVKLIALYGLLTAKEKSSVSFIIESILLGRHSYEELKKKLDALEAMSAMMNALVTGAQEAENSKTPLDVDGMAEKLDKFLDKRSKNHKKPD